MEFENIALGVDIEDIERFENNRLKKPAQHIAARFCAKEAIFKALSALKEHGIEFNKIDIYHNKEVPCVRFLSDLEKKYQAKLSLSHDKTKAVAYVIITKRENTGEQK